MSVQALVRWNQFCGLCLLTWFFPGAIRAGDDIVWGMSAAFKGSSRGLGIELYRGSMAYLEHVNRSGGVQGRKIVIKAYDDGYNPTPAIENTVRLIEQDNPLLLYGYVGTPTVTRVLPLLKIYSDRSVYLFFPFTGAQPQREAPYDDFVFNLRTSFHDETRGLVDNFVRIGRKRIAVFYQIDSYGRGGWDGVRKGLERHKLAVVGEATYRRGTPFSQSLAAQVEILRKAEPDAVISVGAYAACAAFIRDARDAGWDVPIANIAFVGSENLLSLLLESGRANGKDYAKDLINSQVVPSYHDTHLPAVREYRQLMSRYDPMPPAELIENGYQPLPYSYVSLEGFLNAKLLVEILRKMGKDIRRERIKPAVESIDKLDLGIDVPVSFGPNKHQGLGKVYFTTVSEGHFVRLDDWKRWSK
jgi:ABC-type branched-subunit amino acid transport system substrate-binding protein